MIRILLSVLALVLGLSALPALAQDKPTADQIKALTLDAAQFVQTRGVDAARQAFDAAGPYRSGETYVNVIDGNGTWLIYPPNPKLEGKSVLNVRDADGKLLVQDIIALARDKGEGWVQYRWLNPASNRIEPKMSYVKYLSDKGMVVYVGMYR